MTEVMMEKVMGGLRPASEEADRVMGNIAGGTKVIVNIRDPRRRSNQQNAYWHALLDLVWENHEGCQKFFGTQAAFKANLLHRLGYSDQFKQKDGSIVAVAKSVAFANMEQEEFHGLVTSTLAFFQEELGFPAGELAAEARAKTKFDGEVNVPNEIL